MRKKIVTILAFVFFITVNAQDKKWTLQECVNYALDHNIQRLAEDHQKVLEIGQILENLHFIKKVEPIETNIIIFEIDEKAISEFDFVNQLAEKGISIIGMGQGKLRIVTHMDYTNAMHGSFLAILKNL